MRLTIKSTAPVPAVFLRKAPLTLKIKNLSQLSPFRRTTLSLLVPTNIAKLAVYPDISPQYIQAHKSPSQAIHGAVNATPTPIQDMGVNHGRADVLVAEELLEGPDAMPILEQVSGEGMLQRVAGCGLCLH